ncbi:hypothetical protein C8R47DRAFT_175446 [Mycena vitilis]|nr:hypothetical protein C8R47DRAFT_175446 [Mycena vitilis]
MSGIGLLVPDVLCEIMLALPLGVDQKIAFAQVSQLWRIVALDSELFWSSFSGTSKLDCARVPLVLKRSGSSSMLRIQFRFHDAATDWPAEALEALVPYVARIETLDVHFRVPVDITALLNSDLEFSSLRILRLDGPPYDRPLKVWLKAPSLQTLDVQRIDPTNLSTLLSPTLEDIELRESGGYTLGSLLKIFEQCPLARRVVLHHAWGDAMEEEEFDHPSRRPLAPALRELELRLGDFDLALVLKTGFSDVVLPTLTGCISNGHGEDDLELLTTALLPGVGPLVVFKFLDIQEIELHDEGGRIRRLQCWNDDSLFEVEEVWRYLSIHYGVHETVREIRIDMEFWDECVKGFAACPPQSHNGITLGFEIDDIDWVVRNWKNDGDGTKMQVPGLTKVELWGPSDGASWTKAILKVLTHIEAPPARHVEVCVCTMQLKLRDTERDDLVACLASLPGDHWVVCSHCLCTSLDSGAFLIPVVTNNQVH